jgi:hypothetical protein
MKDALIPSPCGCLLTPEQARTVRAKLNASERTTHSGGRNGGRPVSCECGKCAACKRRAKRRATK